MSTQSISSHENVLTRSRLGPLRQPWIVETVLEWQRRQRSRRELATLSEMELRDIGYPARAEAEIAKPFWRA
jgi:uncharacterized protein YjiS (DUF1127 family)